ncbi:MAG TPA: PH domain-containing protein [Woeseiaceae bacterium]
MKMPKCNECGHLRTDKDAAAPLVKCPACDVPYAWSNTPLPAGYMPQAQVDAPEQAPRAPRSRRPAGETAKSQPTNEETLGGRYVRDTLTKGEVVLYVARLHWIIYVPGAALLLIGLMAVGGGNASGHETVGSSLVLWIGLFLLARAALVQYSTEMAITTKRVVGKTGFIRRQTLDMNHNRVESYSVDQNVLGRMLNYGTVVVRGTGSGMTSFPQVVDPLAYRRKAAELADQPQ